MALKINISLNGKAYKIESENEFLVGKRIGETINGKDIDENLSGYELIITGTSDLSGIPGFKGLEGPGYHRRLLTFGQGMKDRRKGIRLRKTNRGEEISLKTHQVNINVVKEGDKKFKKLIGGDSKDSEGDEQLVEKSTDEKSKIKEIQDEQKPNEGISDKEQENISNSLNERDVKSTDSNDISNLSKKDENLKNSKNLGDADITKNKPVEESNEEKLQEEKSEDKK